MALRLQSRFAELDSPTKRPIATTALRSTARSVKALGIWRSSRSAASAVRASTKNAADTSIRADSSGGSPAACRRPQSIALSTKTSLSGLSTSTEAGRSGLRGWRASAGDVRESGTQTAMTLGVGGQFPGALSGRNPSRSRTHPAVIERRLTELLFASRWRLGTCSPTNRREWARSKLCRRGGEGVDRSPGRLHHPAPPAHRDR